ncbi:MAG: hypothetical protein M1816_000729 [Peltula sp. TS41687]|nr:MAG: hypothetical protein M1816_000729 [Peltula sp. TS41687]
MRTVLIWALLLSCTISYLQVLAFGLQGQSIPTCAPKCWENSKYVTQCGAVSECLCADNEYQNAVFLCLNSQCPTPQYAPALHYTLAQCSRYGLNGSDTSPPLLRGSQRQPQADNDDDTRRYRSASVLPSATRSLRRRFATASVTASARPSRTPFYGSAYGSIVKRARPTPTPAP